MEPLLLLHGHGGSSRDWAHLFDLDELGRRWRVIAPDLRGPTHRACAADVRALLDELGVARCRGLGVSMGGNVLLHLADRLDAMVLVSATMYFPAQARAIMREAGGLPRAWAERHDDLCFTPPELATIAARALIVYGDRDPLYPVEMAVEMYRAIPRAELWVLPGAGHTPVFDEAVRSQFARTALAFLEAAS